jgi:hypothetical protein
VTKALLEAGHSIPMVGSYAVFGPKLTYGSTFMAGRPQHALASTTREWHVCHLDQCAENNGQEEQWCVHHAPIRNRILSRRTSKTRWWRKEK